MSASSRFSNGCSPFRKLPRASISTTCRNFAYALTLITFLYISRQAIHILTNNNMIILPLQHNKTHALATGRLRFSPISHISRHLVPPNAWPHGMLVATRRVLAMRCADDAPYAQNKEQQQKIGERNISMPSTASIVRHDAAVYAR